MEALGLSGDQLKGLKKSAPEKALLAWLARKKTMVSLDWLSRTLAIGHIIAVSAGVSKVVRSPSAWQKRALKKLKRAPR